jgi:two-component system, cell cycle response regulator CpdR
VLVVDDELLVVLFVASMLEDLGCEVETAHDGVEALAKISRNARIETVLTDLNMPEMSGYELAEQATQVRPELKVILMSGAETEPRGLLLIRKPILQSDLVRVMRAATSGC